MRKLIKAWNKLPAGAAVTTDPLEQVVLVDPGRMDHLEKEGHLAPGGMSPPQRRGLLRQGLEGREIPEEVRTGGRPAPRTLTVPVRTSIEETANDEIELTEAQANSPGERELEKP